jgi:hypothetical protein
MAEILCVYRQVAMLRGHAATGQDSGGGESLAIVSYDEKPGIQAIGTTATDRPPLPGTSPTVMSDHGVQAPRTLTLMASIDLLTGHVHALVKERHRSREFVELLKLLDAAYRDRGHSRQPFRSCLAREHELAGPRRRSGALPSRSRRRMGHGSISSRASFSKLARSLLRHIRVSSKHELKERLIAFIGDINREPVVHTGATKSTIQHDPHRYVILETLY